MRRKNKIIKNLVLVGAGNLAVHLAAELRKKNYNILQVYSRKMKTANNLAVKLGANPTDNINELTQNADMYIISVVDAAIKNVLEQLRLAKQMVIHTSGTTGIHVFEDKFENFGVFYPLQTFSKEKAVDFGEIPIFVEANTKTNENILFEFAKTISPKVFLVDSETRKQIHIAAVFACNFTNHMFAIANRLLDNRLLSMEILAPLLKETLRKALESNPEEVQTGPAVRNDKNTIESHLDLLSFEPKIQQLYKLISENIQAFRNTPEKNKA